MVHTLATRRLSRSTPDTVAGPLPVPEVPETVGCPECGQPAVVDWRDMVDGTDGPVEHVKIRCTERHWFLMPSETLRR